MTYDYLVYCLAEFGGQRCSSTGEDIRVQAAQLMETKYVLGGQIYYNKDFIFVGHVSDLPEDPEMGPHDAVCIEDSPVSESYRDSGVVNLVLVSGDADLMKLFNCVVFNLADDTRVLNHGLFLAELDTNRISVSRFLQMAYERLHNPLLLVTMNNRVIASCYKNRTLNQRLQDDVRSGILGQDQMEKIRRNDIVPSYREHGIILYSEQVPAGEKWAVQPIKVHGFVIAFLLMANSETMFFNSDFFFLEKMGEILGDLMKEEADIYSDEGLMHSSLFIDLITEPENKTSLQERIQYLKWVFSDNMYLFSVDYSGHKGMELINSIKKTVSYSRYLIYGTEIIMMLEMKKDEVSEVMKDLERLLEKNGLQGILSARFSSPFSMKNRYFQIQRIKKISERIKDASILKVYEDYVNYYEAEQVYELHLWENYIPEGFKTLIDYDNNHRAGLLDTLEVYLKSGGLNDTALQKLCISKSTAYYRLTKIRDTLRLSLEDGSVRMLLGISLALYKLYGNSIIP